MTAPAPTQPARRRAKPRRLCFERFEDRRLLAADIASGLVGHWPLDESAIGQTVVDASSSANDGQHVNLAAPAGPDPQAAVGNFSLRVDGLDDYVAVPPSPSLDLSGGQFTEALWIRSEVVAAGFHGVLGYQQGPSAQRYPGIWIEQQTGLHLGFGDGTTWNSFSVADVITPFTWNHVAATFDGTSYKLYVDGAQVASRDDYAGKIPVALQQLHLGRVDGFFAGSLDDVRVYNRALQADDVLALVALGPDSEPPQADLLHLAYGSNIDISVRYRDNLAVDVATIDSNDLRITGPNSFGALAGFLTIDEPTNGSPRTAVYRLPAPSPDGVYSISLEANQVTDERGNPVAAVALGSFLIDNASTEPDRTGLVGHWQLEQSAIGQVVTDASGFENHGQHVNLQPPEGPDNYAAVGLFSLRTDGVDDLVSIPPRAALELSGGVYTQALWVQPELTTDGFFGVLGYQQGTSVERCPGIWVLDQNRLHVGFGDGTNWNSLSTGAVLTPSQWNHVATTFDGTTLGVYVNGIEVASTTDYAGRAPAPTQQLDLGRVDSHFAGRIDDVRIYKRSLAAGEVFQLFAMGPDTEAPTAEWINAAHGANVDLTIQFSDNLAVDVSSLDDNDLRITGPNGFEATASLIDVSSDGPETIRTAIYRIATPAANGDYSVLLEPNQVADLRGNLADGGLLGTVTIDDTSLDPDPSGLVGHWRLDETALGQTVVDASGFGNHGVHVNLAAPDGPDTNAAVGTRSLHTDGVDDRVSVAASASLNLGAGVFTQSLWLQPETPAGGFHGLLGYQDGVSADRYPGIWVIGQDGLHVGFGDGVSWNSLSVAGVLSTSDWNHLTATFDGTTYTIYVNSVPVASTPDYAGRVPVGVGQLDLGRVDSHFQGRIDDVRIYKRALDATEVGMLYHLGLPGTLQLPTNSFTVNEPDGSVTIGVQRIGGSRSAVTVDYTTVDDVATSPLDYTTSQGTLTFAEGQTVASITIPVVNDNAGETNETFAISLDAVGGGAALGFPRTGIVTIIDDDPPAGSGSGLRGEYYNNLDLTDLALIRTDPVVNFDWLAGSPDPVIDPNTFSVRWTGQLEAETTETYSLHVTTDDGARLWIDGQLLIDNWVDQAATTATATIDLIAGYRYDVVLEFYENGGSASARLEWSSAGQPLEVVPSTQLYDGSLAGATFALAADTLNVNEESVTAELQVLRLGDVSGTASLEVSFSDITATAGLDYTVSPPTLNFADGQASATITISLVDDGDPEVNETFDLLLSNPVNAVLGTRSFTTVKIIDNDPGDFFHETYISGLNQPTMFDWATDGRMYVAHKSGLVTIYDNGQLQGTFVDISDQVNDVRDRGMLGFALSPDFPATPHAYLLFTYDPPEVYQNSGLAGPDQKGNRVSRLIRVTADATSNYSTVVPGSEEVLLGTGSIWQNISEPGMDSTGDPSIPASCPPNGTLVDCIPIDSQSHTIGMVQFGLDGSLLVSSGDGTSYGMVDPRTVRVQDLDSLSGKLLRIDPLNGNGLPDNPFYDGNPTSNRSKVYSYGLRNPFRFAVHPTTGEPFVGDVGWTKWEEINTGRGANFGWPYYEGGNGISLQTGGYSGLAEAQAFYASGQPVVPALYARTHADGARAIVVGDFYDQTAFPALYHGALFLADVNEGTIDVITFDAEGNPQPVRRFASGFAGLVHMATGADGNLYYTNVNGHIGRILPGGSGPAQGPGGGGPGGASAGNTFFVVDAADDANYYYPSLVSQPQRSGLSHRNRHASGVAATVDGSRRWVVDLGRRVFVYDERATAIGDWHPLGVRRASGIASDGNDVWIVDQSKRRVFQFAGGADKLKGHVPHTFSFPLDPENLSPTGLTGDGVFLWVVDDQADAVFKYTIAGLLVGRWGLEPTNTSPQGITHDPTGFSNRLWVVDLLSRQTFEYAEGADLVTGVQQAHIIHNLAPDNAHPLGIADPLPHVPSTTPRQRSRNIPNPVIDEAALDELLVHPLDPNVVIQPRRTLPRSRT